jgi:hypothetical protein
MCEDCKDLTCCSKWGSCVGTSKQSVAELLARAFNPPAELPSPPASAGRILLRREVPDHLLPSSN